MVTARVSWVSPAGEESVVTPMDFSISPSKLPRSKTASMVPDWPGWYSRRPSLVLTLRQEQ